MEYAQSNVREALSAIQFLPIAKVQRWTNRLNEVTDEEQLRYYCRSAMIGVWGISTDLTLIDDNQKVIIKTEIDHYRTLNKAKVSQLYEILLPREDNDCTGIIYYENNREKAYAMLVHSDLSKQETLKIIPKGLNPHYGYTVINLDTDESIAIPAGSIQTEGFTFTPKRGDFRLS